MISSIIERLIGPKGPDESSRIRAMVRTEFALADHAVVVVNELECSEPGCPPIHTAIFVFWPQSVEHYKLQRPMAEVDASDIQALALTRCQPKSKEEHD